MFKNILLAYDGSDLQQKEIIECSDLKNWPNAEITLLMATPSVYTSMGMEGVFVGDDSVYDNQVRAEIF